MADKRKWLTLDQAETQREQTSERERGRDSLADEQKLADERRARLLKIRMLETRIEATTIATKQRKQKIADDRDAITAEIYAGIDNEQNDRIASIHETFQRGVSRFFMIGTGALLAFCLLGISVFTAIVINGMILAIVGLPLP